MEYANVPARTGSFSSSRRVSDSSLTMEAAVDTAKRSSSAGDAFGDGYWRVTGKPTYTTKLNSQEMKSLVAVCDTILPCIIFANAAGTTVEGGEVTSSSSSSSSFSSDLTSFFSMSASMTGTPQHVGGLITEGMQHPSLWQLRLALWLLSTWYGTLSTCGTACFSKKFPYVRSFPRLPPRTREKVLLSWAHSRFNPFLKLFKAFKLLTLYTFFSQVDEKNMNPTWKAIDYCGPDPDHANKRKQMKETMAMAEAGQGRSREATTEERRRCYGPLYAGLVDMGKPRATVVEKLEKAGFPVTVGRHLKKGLMKKKGASPCPLVIKCDAVVVGSGSGGGVVAGVLAASGYKVLVLEKGNYLARCQLSLLEGPTSAEMYDSRGLMASEDMGTIFLAGSTVGGGSAVNWSASIPTPAHVTREWSDALCLELFASKAYKQSLEAVCKRMGVQSGVDKEGFNCAILRKGCTELGYPICNIPRNSTSDHYCGWCHLGCKDGKKKGTNETWLVDLVDSGNGLILPRCNVVKVLKRWTKGKWAATGVAFEHASGFPGRSGRKEMYVVEAKVTVVACGALRTPSLLKKSGLKNANIGRHLHVHPTVMAWGYFPESPSGWPEPDLKSYEGGIMTAMSTVVGNFGTSGYGAVIQTPALHPGMFSGVTPWTSGVDIKERMTRFSRTAHIFALARDTGSGRVDFPRTLDYKMDSTDEEHLQRALEKMLRILAAAGAQEIGTQHIRGERLDVKKASYHEFERFVKREAGRRLRDLSTPICSAHQMGSCRMGVDPKSSVVNERGETWEVEGLFLADTSVFPTALGVNPMVTVQAIAYCTAQSIVEILGRKKPGL